MRARKNTPAQNFARDLIAPRFPRMIERSESIRITSLARDLAAGKITLAEMRSELRGAS